MEIISCNDEDFRQCLSQQNFSLVRFYAEWCGTCKLLYPYFIEYAENTELDQLIFIDVNIDEAPVIESEFDVKMVPSFAFFVKGELYKSIQPTNEEELLLFIKDIEDVIDL